MTLNNLKRYMNYWVVLFVTLQVGGLSGQAIAASESFPTYHSMVMALHVHSTWSTGSLTLDQLAERALQLEIDAILLADNFALRYEYGLHPLRGVFRYSITLPSLFPQNISAYLANVEAVQKRHPNLVMIPGVEVVPHYYWTGSLFQGNLTMHNSQRNLLVYGLNQPGQYDKLPTSGNITANTYGWETLNNLVPILLLVPAVWLWRRGRRRKNNRMGLKGVGAVLAVLTVCLLGNAWPFSQPVHSPYNSQLAYHPYQTVIDTVQKEQGIVIWSLPEARDYQKHSFRLLGDVAIETVPHSEALIRTKGFTGFGGLYQDTRHIQEPGGMWDQALGQFMHGIRTAQPILFGEIALHKPGEAGKALDQVVNVVQVKNRSPEGVIEAMRQGRLFAAARTKEGIDLRLNTFQLECPDGTCFAQIGEHLKLDSGRGIAIRVGVSARDGGAYPITMTLIRSGEVLKTMMGHTPFQQVFIEKHENSLSPSYYRVEIKGAGEVLSNPIFVTLPEPKSSVADRRA